MDDPPRRARRCCGEHDPCAVNVHCAHQLSIVARVAVHAGEVKHRVAAVDRSANGLGVENVTEDRLDTVGEPHCRICDGRTVERDDLDSMVNERLHDMDADEARCSRDERAHLAVTSATPR